MKEVESIFNNIMSWKPFSFRPSAAINNEASKIKRLCVCVCARASTCVFLILSHMCVSVSEYRDNKTGGRCGEENKTLGMVCVCFLRTCEDQLQI